MDKFILAYQMVAGWLKRLLFLLSSPIFPKFLLVAKEGTGIQRAFKINPQNRSSVVVYVMDSDSVDSRLVLTSKYRRKGFYIIKQEFNSISQLSLRMGKQNLTDQFSRG